MKVKELVKKISFTTAIYINNKKASRMLSTDERRTGNYPEYNMTVECVLTNENNIHIFCKEA